MKSYDTECYKTTISGFDIKLEQSRAKHRLFTVTYGQQVTKNLSYGDACSELGT